MSELGRDQVRFQTPSQTVGPFFGYALPYDGGPELVGVQHPDALRLHGMVLDGVGAPVPDAVVEVWQPDSRGEVFSGRGSLDRDGYTFTGFGRTATNRSGEYTFTTVRPGAKPGRLPFVLVTVFARGLLHHLFTRAYFGVGNGDGAGADAGSGAGAEADAVAEFMGEDPLLRAVPADRRHTLFVVPEEAIAGIPSVRFDIRLQGENETVFLDFDAPAGDGPAGAGSTLADE